MWEPLDTTQLLSIIAASSTLLYTTIAQIPRQSCAVLRTGCVALVAGAFLDAPLLGFSVFVVALGYAATTRNRSLPGEYP